MDNNSGYVSTLPAAERARYVQKLAVIDGFDPYNKTRGKGEWKHEEDLTPILPAVCYPDIVNYLLFTPSAYTADDLKAYKGLQAYNYVVSGLVRDITAVVKKNLHIVMAKFLVDCTRISSLPVVSFVLNGVEYDLTADVYIRRDTINEEEICISSFQASDISSPFGPIWILGDIFISQVYSIYDRDKDRVGLAQLSDKAKNLSTE